MGHEHAPVHPAGHNSAKGSSGNSLAASYLHDSGGEFWERLRKPGPDYWVDRSLSELLSTARLIIAGFDADAAWQVVSDPAHLGFHRARKRGHRWWVKHCWNAAVEYVDDHRNSRTGKSASERWKKVTGPLLAGVRKLHWPNWTTATRHSREHILAAIGDRMARQGLACRPLPERDLENDTGKSRNTIRDALEAFVEDGVLIRTRTYDQSMGPKASHEFSLNLLALDFRAETSEPPCSHSPAPAAGPGSASLRPWPSTPAPSPSRSSTPSAATPPPPHRPGPS